LILVFIIKEKLPQADQICLGVSFALIGMFIFNVGIELGLSKLGNQVGQNLPASFTTIEITEESKIIKNFSENYINRAVMEDGKVKNFFYTYIDKEYVAVDYEAEKFNRENNDYNYIPKKGPIFGDNMAISGLLVILIFAFFMGYGATLAEPALNALGITVEEITVGTFKKSLLMQSVAIGVGVGIMIGVAKIIWNIPLLYILIPPYLLLLIITKISSEEFVDIGWDSAGVTTGPITVPLVLAMGLGIGGQVGVVEGFGILAVASVTPILSVLLVGLYVDYNRKRAIKELK